MERRPRLSKATVNPAIPSLFAWLFGITLTVVLSLAGMMWMERREMAKRLADQASAVGTRLAEQERRFTEMATMMASVMKAAEIYERTQERAAETYARTHDSLLGTLREMTKSTHEMYRDAASRFAQLEERTTNHAQELRRVAENTHNIRTETRNALEKNVSELREDITRVAQQHHEDMARIQLRRHGDTDA